MSKARVNPALTSPTLSMITSIILWGDGIRVAVECGVDCRDDALILVDHDVARIHFGRVSHKLLFRFLRHPQRLSDLVLGWKAEVLLTEVVVAGRVPVTPLCGEKVKKASNTTGRF